MAPCILTRACFPFYRKKCVLAGGLHFVPAHPFYQKHHPWSCQQCLRESHPIILCIWERGLTSDVAFPTQRTVHQKAWHEVLVSLFLPQNVKNIKLVSFFLFLFFFQLGKLLSVDAVSFPDSILCKLHIGKWNKQICPWSFLVHGETGLSQTEM